MIKNIKQPGTAILLSGLAIITLYFNTSLEDPFSTPKLILLLLLSAWISGHLISSYKKFGFSTKEEERKVNFIVVSLISFMLISSYLADMPLIAFFGDVQRRNGFMTYLSLIILFLFSFRTSNENLVTRFYKATIIIGLVMSIYGVLQISGKDFVAWLNPNNSMISTLGNPNFASAMLAVISMLCIASIFIDISLPYKVLAILVVPLSLYAIIKSNSLQGLVVIAVALGFYLTIKYLAQTKRFKIRLIFILPYLIVSCVGIAGMLQKGPLSSILYKDSVSVRGFYWRAAFEMIRDNLWFGVGSDRYGAFFKLYREVEYPIRYGYDITSSNAHNVFLQLFATNGILVGVFYLVLIGMVFIIGLRKVFSSEPLQSKVLLGLLSAWLGFQAQALISIDQIGVSVWGWILGGLILGFSDKESRFNKPSKLEIKSPNQIKKVELNVLQVTTSTILLFPMVWISTLLYNAESDTWLSRSEFSNSDSIKLLEYSEKVFDNPLNVPTNKTKVASYLIEKGYSDKGLIALKKIYRADYRDLDALRVMAYAFKKENNLVEEIRIRLLVSKLDPYDAPNYLRLCQMYVIDGNIAEAMAMKDKVLSIAPNSEIADLALAAVGAN